LSRFEDAIAVLTAETGWEPIPSDRPGGVRFELEDGPDLELFAPDGRHLFFQALLAEAGPDENPEHAAEALARQAAATALKRASILSFDGRTFHLHLALDLKEAGPGKILAGAKAFLNDWDWWRLNAAPASAPAPAGPWLRL